MENKNKTLTLVVPSYNMERYLSRCLDSVIVDDEYVMESLDVIVVNDGSHDRTLEIAQGYAEKYPRTFRVIDKENGNYGSCINAGLKAAWGKYIRPLDADDYVVTANLSIILQTLDKIDADAVVTDFTEVSDTCETLRDRNFNLLATNKLFDIDDTLLNYGLPMHALTYRTDLLRDIDYRQTEGIFYSDQEWNFLPFKAVRTLYYLPQVFYQYVMGRTGQSVDPAVEQKHMDSNTTVLLSQLRCMATVDKSTPNYKYMFHYLKYLSIHIYFAILLADPYSKENERLLRDADSQMKTLSPELYAYLDGLKISFGYYLIRRWRQGKPFNVKILRRFIPLYNLYLRIRHAFRRILPFLGR